MGSAAGGTIGMGPAPPDSKISNSSFLIDLLSAPLLRRPGSRGGARVDTQVRPYITQGALDFL